MEIETVFVTGANRGLGLEFVRQLVHLPKAPRYVFATYRNEDTVQALKSIRDEAKDSEVILIKMDVTKLDEIQSARKVIQNKIEGLGLNLLINNSGVMKPMGFPDLTEENIFDHFFPNTVGSVMVVQEMLPLLQQAAKRNSSNLGLSASRAAVLNMSSLYGSIERAETGPYKMPQFIGYKMSKAALNMSMRVIASQVKDKGILVVLMCPGWVKTDMGTENAQLEVYESVSAVFKTLSQLDENHHGSFMNLYGETIPF